MRQLTTILLAAAAAQFMAGAALAAEDLPKRKSGLWEIKTSSPNIRDEARRIELCVDQKADDLTGQAAADAKKMCSKMDTHREGGRLTMDSVCKLAGTTATTRSVITGNFDSSYRVETSSTYEPPLSGMAQSSATIDARWLGPCKADQRAGDMILGNGTKINIHDTVKGR